MAEKKPATLLLVCLIYWGREGGTLSAMQRVSDPRGTHFLLFFLVEMKMAA